METWFAAATVSFCWPPASWASNTCSSPAARPLHIVSHLTHASADAGAFVITHTRANVCDFEDLTLPSLNG